MRVLQLIKTSFGAGWALRHVKELVKYGVEVHVALPIDGPLVKKYKEVGAYVHELNYSLKNILGTIKGLRKIVAQVQPDIIHSHFVLTTLIMRLALRSSRIPRIFQVPGPLHLENVFFRKLEIGLSQKKQDYWIGTCKWTNERYLKSGVKSDHLFLCYYGMDMEYVKRYPGILKQTLGLKETDIVVGMVAYVYAPKKILGQKQGLKGHEDFIDAISLLLDKYPNLYGVCIGGAATDKAVKYEQTIKKYALTKCGNRIIFLGTRTDVPQLYGNMDIAVHPSHSENLGGAAESLLLEVPTITSTVGGFPDIIHNKENGLLVPPHNPVELSKAISAMLEGQYDLQSFKEKGKTLMLEMLDVKDTARILISVYNKILEQNSRKNV